jgi:predicted RNA-binding protein associated with RNAse of E/G family
MKTTFALLALLPLAFTAPAASAAAPRAAVVAQVPDFKSAVSPSIDELRKKVEAGKVSAPDFKKVTDEIKSASAAQGVVSPETTAITERLLARIMELELLAQTKMFELLELDILKDQAIDADLAFALARLKMKAAENKADKTDWDAVAKSLTARAEAAKAWNPEIDAIIGRLRAEIDALMARAKSAPLKGSDFDTALDIAKESRVSNVLTRLEKRGLEKKALESDFSDVLDVAKRTTSPDPELVKKVQARLDELKAAARAGKITREQFMALRELLMIRARAASSPK